ncbi:protein shisa-3 homolog [Artemia franciscana]|uniref:protein shisa-3 homolog n=1 Tax=Artemia franciscana TaxID=6661 RepID=UPI0032D9B893
MSMELSLPMLLHETHRILAEEFCSGYSDAFGKWNTGFYCPKIETEEVYCCGTEIYKYCCNGRDIKSLTNGWTSEDDTLMLMLGITFGAAAGIALLTFISCYLCPGCLLYRKRASISYRQHLPPRSLSTATTQMTISSFDATPSDVYYVDQQENNSTNGNFATFRSASQQLFPRYLPTQLPYRDSSIWETDTDTDSDEPCTLNRRSLQFEPPPPYAYLDPSTIMDVQSMSFPPREESLSRYQEVHDRGTPAIRSVAIPPSRSTKF